MARRYTKKDIGGCASRLADDLGKKFGGCWVRKKGERMKSIVGCWEVDYNPTYGGAVIQEIANTSGGVRMPFGPMRRKPREFCETTKFAQKATRLYKKRGK